MQIVRIQGGLGNQMFQFAFGETLRHIHNMNIYYDISFFNNQNSYIQAGNALRELELAKVFPSVKLYLSRNSLLIHSEPGITLYNKVLGKLGYKVIEGKLFNFFKDPENQYLNFDRYGCFDSKIYFDGYWQNLKYWERNKSFLCENYSFDKEFLEISSGFWDNIENSVSAAIHIRKGDYLNSKHFRNIDLSYYKKAIKHLLEFEKNTKFYIFTDDIKWVKENLFELKKISSNVFLAESSDLNISGLDMYVMSLFNHNIISNSTYSWWAAYLNRFPEKKCFAPYDWTNDAVTNKYIRESLLKDFNLLTDF
jgi:hypothetical protein